MAADSRLQESARSPMAMAQPPMAVSVPPWAGGPLGILGPPRDAVRPETPSRVAGPETKEGRAARRTDVCARFGQF
eukprot:2341661-Alexandrium_andersonii.AAC.1